MLILTGLSWSNKFQPHFMSLMPQIKGTFFKNERFKNEAMAIWKEDDKSSWEHYHIILLSHIALYWIWSSLDSDETLVVTRVSPPVFGLQYCCVFRKRMKLNMGGLWLNTLFLHYLFHHLFLYFLFFSSISLPSVVYICSFSILSFSIFSFSLCWSLLACLGVINFNFISYPSCLK